VGVVFGTKVSVTFTYNIEGIEMMARELAHIARALEEEFGGECKIHVKARRWYRFEISFKSDLPSHEIEDLGQAIGRKAAVEVMPWLKRMKGWADA
jgi:hypothetical protein